MVCSYALLLGHHTDGQLPRGSEWRERGGEPSGAGQTGESPFLLQCLKSP